MKFLKLFDPKHLFPFCISYCCCYNVVLRYHSTPLSRLFFSSIITIVHIPWTLCQTLLIIHEVDGTFTDYSLIYPYQFCFQTVISWLHKFWQQAFNYICFIQHFRINDIKLKKNRLSFLGSWCRVGKVLIVLAFPDNVSST